MDWFKNIKRTVLGCAFLLADKHGHKPYKPRKFILSPRDIATLKKCLLQAKEAREVNITILSNFQALSEEAIDRLEKRPAQLSEPMIKQVERLKENICYLETAQSASIERIHQLLETLANIEKIGSNLSTIWRSSTALRFADYFGSDQSKTTHTISAEVCKEWRQQTDSVGVNFEFLRMCSELIKFLEIDNHNLPEINGKYKKFLENNATLEDKIKDLFFRMNMPAPEMPNTLTIGREPA